MKKNYLCLAVILVLLIPGYGNAQSKVPASWQPGMKITANYSGGQSPYSYSLEITDSLSTFKLRTQNGQKNYKKTFSKEELDGILKFLATQKFDRIKSEYTGFTHDKASQSIILSWGRESIGASQSSNQSIVESYRDNFIAIEQYLQELFDKSGKK